MSTTTNVTSLIINKLTKAQYEAIQNPDPTQLYFIIDDNEYAEVSDLPQPSNTAPGKDGTAAAGVAATYSRSDHIHPAEIPNQSGNSGKFLTTNGSTVSWATVDALPSQSGNSGKFLTTNGTTASWAIVDALPDQTGNSGKFLRTNGTVASWVDLGSIVTFKGTKATINALPASGNKTGDMWLVTANNSEYIWTGDAWEEIGPTIDLSGYAPLDSPAFIGIPTTPTPEGETIAINSISDISLTELETIEDYLVKFINLNGLSFDADEAEYLNITLDGNSYSLPLNQIVSVSNASEVVYGWGDGYIDSLESFLGTGQVTIDFSRYPVAIGLIDEGENAVNLVIYVPSDYNPTSGQGTLSFDSYTTAPESQQIVNVEYLENYVEFVKVLPEEDEVVLQAFIKSGLIDRVVDNFLGNVIADKDNNIAIIENDIITSINEGGEM